MNGISENGSPTKYPKHEEQAGGRGRTDLLLRLFDSDFFDEWMAVSYLYKHSETGIEDYICNRLYDFPESKIETYLPQICVMLATKGGDSLEKLFMDLCSKSLRIAVKGYWLLSSFIDDFQKNEAQQTYLRKLCNHCCDAALSGHWVPPFKDHLVRTHKQAKLAGLAVSGLVNGINLEDKERRSDGEDSCDEDLTSESPDQAHVKPDSVPVLQLAECADMNDSNALFSPLTSPRMRKNTFAATLDLFEALCEVSARLATIPEAERKDTLVSMLEEINEALESPEAAGSACIFPLSDKHERVLKIHAKEAQILNSREKVPFMLVFEVSKEGGDPRSSFTTPVKGPHESSRNLSWKNEANGDTPHHSRPNRSLFSSPSKSENFDSDFIEDEHCNSFLSEDGPLSDPEAAQSVSDAIDEAMTSICGEPPVVSIALKVKQQKVAQERGWLVRRKSVTIETVKLEIKILGKDLSFRSNTKKSHRKSRRVPSHEALKFMAAKHNKAKEDFDEYLPKEDPPSVAIKKAAGTYVDIKGMFGDSFATRKAKARRESIFGRQPGWDLQSIIVKAGDDCRQELMAVQIINEFHNIFVQDGLKACVRPINVLVTSSHSGIIETVVDAYSIHSIKCKLPKYYSLADYYDEKFGKGSQELYIAKRNFVESMAGYSIVCYLLQIKDRHNANILLDKNGYVVHIDFGFMLSNSPGGINFETAPFKLTREFLEVMDSNADGKSSELFDYFKILCIQTFLTCRKHAERILNLVEMMQLNSFPCFSGGPRVMNALRKRFHLSATEEQCIDIVLNMIGESMDAWRTRQYDYYQRVLNGIL